ncbi:Glycine--tRNA ligase beta subunit [Nymphon striatum]|nr:Glycine--tRNA ligase beta subunit [Nymphon striatum]
MGIFAIDMKPTGSKDPFSLRRAALGLLRIIIEGNLNLDLKAMLTQAAKGLTDKVAEFAKMAESESLAAANKRISNILKKVETEIPQEVDESLLNEAQEKALYDAISAQQSIVQPLFANGDYSQALTSLAVLREDVDNFFDNIMVMDDNEAVKK